MLKLIPNAITLARTLAALVIPLMILDGDAFWRAAALILFIVAGITDWLDGMLARQLKAQSNFGRMLDPIADKLLLAGCLLALVAIDSAMREAWGMAFFLPVLLIILREMLISGLREYVATHKIILHVTWTAKVKTTMQIIACGFAIAIPVAPAPLAFATELITIILLWVATGFTVVSGWEYFVKALRHDIFS